VTVVNTTANPVPVTTNAPLPVTVTNPTTSVTLTNPSVTVNNTASSPVPTQNVGGGQATHLGQKASQIIALQCQEDDPCTDFAFNNFTVPAGKVLVITDVQWTIGGTTIALSADLNAPIFVNVAGVPVAVFSAITDRTGTAMGQARMTTGVVAKPGNTISLGVNLQGVAHVGTLQGYLVANE